MAIMPRPGPVWGRSEPSGQGARPPAGARPALRLRIPGDSSDSSDGSPLETLLAEFVTRWERGEAPRAEEYLDRLPPGRPEKAVELIYREFCLAEAAGLDPDPAAYLTRFPAQSEGLGRLFRLHKAFSSADLRDWAGPVGWPEVGDEIGPYALERELGRGAFARVFLARQADLDDRLVVVKVSRKITPEPRLLARARHPHIVEVFSHGTIDDGAFQLITMPFLGGATLAAVLAERRGKRPGSGRALLADLDRVAAPDYTAATRYRPAREFLATLSYPKAVAWIAARLAEALAHAFECGVAHGDIKPSNVLLTADGNPMLLDFNLAVGWEYRRAKDPLSGAGGTLAYMAPERLAALAEPDGAPAFRASDHHRADIYALGVVLLEALTGRAPDPPRGPARTCRELAAAYLDALPGRAEAPAWPWRRSVPPGLRPILERCLAHHPADRYQRASELAEDLDRWRNDLPLVHAREPGGPSAWLRRARRHRLALVSTCLCVGVAATLGALGTSWAEARRRAEAHLARYWDRADSGVFRFRRFDRWRTVEPGDPALSAWRHLAHFGVTEADDWRRRADFRDLPRPLREELEVWLLEQALRYGHAISARADAPHDWRRALAVLERVTASAPLRPLDARCRLLRRRLGAPEPPAPANRPAPPRWMENYLCGVEAELDQRRAADGLAAYERALEERPRSFWAHYRAAAFLYRLGRYAAAADHLSRCIEQRPDNPPLRVQLAGCLYEAGDYQGALEACDKAIALDPGLPEPYLSRSFVRKRMGQDDGRAADLRQFERLARARGKATPGKLRLDALFPPRFNGYFDPNVWGSDLPRRILDVDPDDIDAHTLLATQLMQVGLSAHPPAEFSPHIASAVVGEGALAGLAAQTALAAVREGALAELDRVLELNRDHPWALFYRSILRRLMHRAGADFDLDRLLAHPRLEEFFSAFPPAIVAYSQRSWSFLTENDLPQALRAALQGMEAADRHRRNQGELHFALASVYAVAARSVADRPDLALHLVLLHESAEHLKAARSYRCSFDVARQYECDPAFDEVRGELPPALEIPGGSAPQLAWR